MLKPWEALTAYGPAASESGIDLQPVTTWFLRITHDNSVMKSPQFRIRLSCNLWLWVGVKRSSLARLDLQYRTGWACFCTPSGDCPGPVPRYNHEMDRTLPVTCLFYFLFGSTRNVQKQEIIAPTLRSRKQKSYKPKALNAQTQTARRTCRIL